LRYSQTLSVRVVVDDWLEGEEGQRVLGQGEGGGAQVIVDVGAIAIRIAGVDDDVFAVVRHGGRVRREMGA
jgi:hypothetical protein